MSDRIIVTFALLAAALIVAGTLTIAAAEWVGAAVRHHRQRRARHLHPSTPPVEQQTYRWDGHTHTGPRR